MGTPGEESKGGKVLMLRKGAFKDVDCALMAHPLWRTVCDTGCTAVKRFRVEFRGQSAHAAASPELGRNALDAVMLLFQGINAWRQQLPEHARIHGVVEKGGVLPNIIPDFASCIFFLRSTDDHVLEDMEQRFRDIVRGAALMTGTRPRIRPESVPYKSLWTNAHLDDAFMKSATLAGLDPIRPERTGKGSTDFGDVSQAMPGAHFYFGIARTETAIHSPQFEKAAGSDYGIGQMLKMVEALSVIGYQYLSDAAFRKGVDADFKERQCKHG
jgi:amidohydrolase